VNIIKYCVIMLAIPLSGCGSGGYRDADNKVLCDPTTDEAYYVKPGLGEISYLQKNNNLNSLCIKGK
jgi:hypothetical protein